MYGVVADLDGKSDVGHTHTASEVTDFDDAVDALIEAQKNQPDGVLGLDGDGVANAIIVHRTGTTSAINALTLLEGEIAVTNDTFEIRIGDGATPGGVSATSLFNSTSAIFVSAKGSPAQNGAALMAAYAAAESLTPNGSALSSTNRATVLLMPGIYDTSAAPDSGVFILDVDFIDVVGIGGSACVKAVGEWRQFCTDIQLKGIEFKSRFQLYTFPNSVAMSASCRHEDLYFNPSSGACMSVNVGASLVGTYRQCRAAGSSMYGAANLTVAGTFEDCESTGVGLFGGTNITTGLVVFTGTMRRCKHLSTSAWLTRLEGTMIDCEWAVGITRLASGFKIYRCKFTPSSGYSINHNATGITGCIAYTLMKNNTNGGINTTNVTNNLADTNISDDDV